MMLTAAKRIASRSLQHAFVKRHRGRITVGAHCRIPFRTLQIRAKRLIVGDYVRLGDRLVVEGESCTLGDHFFCGHDVGIHGHRARVEIGKFSSVGARVLFLLGQGHHRPQSLANFPFGHAPQFDAHAWTQGFDYDAETETFCRLGHDVWIGVGSLVLPNVAIGDGAIVSAGSVVKHDVPPYAIVGGNPARIICFRFKPSLIEELLAMKWWDWPMEKINRNKPLFTKNLMTRPSLTGLPIA